jgi:CrcB protein
MGFTGFLMVFLGAGLGGGLRYAVGLAAVPLLGGDLPWGTLAVNVIGGFAMGVVAEYWARRNHLSQHTRLFLTTGVFGGFTTFSSFSLDTLLLWTSGRPAIALGYVVISVLGAIGGIFAGLALVRAWIAPTED